MVYDDLRKGRYSETGRIYFVTVIVANRKPLFTTIAPVQAVVQEIKFVEEKKWVESLAWVLMPDHFHWLFALQQGAELSVVMRYVKARSAKSINRLYGEEGAVWQRAFYDHALRKEEDCKGIARYIVANPLRAGLVDDIRYYPFWDAVWI